MHLENALFNWLQISIVANSRKDDQAAQETAEFFTQILYEDHKITKVHYEKEDLAYHIYYEINGELTKLTFDSYIAEKLLDDISSEPKYNQ